jgi:uncharacterized membrane protein HdeD (DUF308 family)
MTEVATPQQTTPQHRRWKWLLAFGAALVVLGVTGVCVAPLLQASFALVFGPMLLVSSILQLLTSVFAEEKGREKRLHYLAAGVEAVFGFVVMALPPQRIIGLVAVIAIFLGLCGLARLLRSMATRGRGRAWAVATGVLALLLALAIGLRGNAEKLAFVGLCIALDFIFHGVSWSALALMERDSAGENRLA